QDALPYVLSVNLSPQAIAYESFGDNLSQILGSSPDSRSRLIVEIDEHALFTERDATRRLMLLLRSLGAQIAVDDFGAGYAPIRLLRDLPIDFLKFDVNHAREYSAGSYCHELLSLTLPLGAQLGATVI